MRGKFRYVNNRAPVHWDAGSGWEIIWGTSFFVETNHKHNFNIVLTPQTRMMRCRSISVVMCKKQGALTVVPHDYKNYNFYKDILHCKT